MHDFHHNIAMMLNLFCLEIVLRYTCKDTAETGRNISQIQNAFKFEGIMGTYSRTQIGFVDNQHSINILFTTFLSPLPNALVVKNQSSSCIVLLYRKDGLKLVQNHRI